MNLTEKHKKAAKYWVRTIKKHYSYHRIKIKIEGYIVIPHLKRYVFKLRPAKGHREQPIFGRSTDIQSTLGVYQFFPYKEESSLYIAVSEENCEENRLLSILQSQRFTENDAQIALALGFDMLGRMFIVDLVELRHLIVVGPSGTGKSVALQLYVLN